MNTVVCEMNPAGEIELTDAQLVAVYGACAECETQCQPVYQPVYQPVCQERSISSGWNANREQSHIESVKKFHQKVAFSFEVSAQEEQEVDQSRSACHSSC